MYQCNIWYRRPNYHRFQVYMHNKKDYAVLEIKVVTPIFFKKICAYLMLYQYWYIYNVWWQKVLSYSLILSFWRKLAKAWELIDTMQSHMPTLSVFCANPYFMEYLVYWVYTTIYHGYLWRNWLMKLIGIVLHMCHVYFRKLNNR